MLRNQIDESPQHNANFPQLPPSQTVSFILSFLDQCLPRFPGLYLSFQTAKSHREDYISTHLSRFFQDEAKNLLFDFGPKEGVDFLIWVKPYNPRAPPLFLIEAKRLPPTNNKDYAQGPTGGIERFKREQKGFDQPLVVGAMVGYVQKNDFSYWHHRINGWIAVLIEQSSLNDDIRWEQQDLLQEFSSGTPQIARYISTHSRKTQKHILLHHFWLNMYR